jgi:hypothetical protein
MNGITTQSLTGEDRGEGAFLIAPHSNLIPQGEKEQFEVT